MANDEIKPFKSELDLLTQKLKLTRLPPNSLASAQWTESSTNKVTLPLISSILETWTTSYSWHDAEAALNAHPHFITSVPVADFGSLEIQFIHSLSSKKDAIPLLFIHGWPGSLIEITKALPLLNEKGFHVVAPSLPSWLSSTMPNAPGFKIDQHAECFANLMRRLGYSKYVLQGGDWGGEIAPMLAGLYPDNVLAMHVNYFPIIPIPAVSKEELDSYSSFEQESLKSFKHWADHETAYCSIQQTKPLTLGIGLHDSPVGMLAWMADKLFSWTDCKPHNPHGYEWTHEELITWTLLHYFGDSGPTGPFHMYVENNFVAYPEGNKRKFVEAPTGVSAYRCEAEMVPRAWAEKRANVTWWKEHALGGHFAMYERPEEMVDDIVSFVDSIGLRSSS